MANKLPLDLFLDSLSISSATDSTWRQVMAAGYDTLEKIRALTVNQLSNIGAEDKRTIGSRAFKIYESLHSPRVEALLDRADAWLDRTPPAKVDTSGLKLDVKGKNIAMTGTAPIPRDALKKMIEAAGGKVASSVTSTTHYLLCESADSQSSKAKAARALGTTVLGYTDVLA